MQQAVFVIAPTTNGYAATTRAVDRGETGKIGLPGGKVDAGETVRGALIRECLEEGWEVYGVESEPFYWQEYDGFMVYWYVAAHAVAKAEYKEQHRITPVTVDSLESLANTGFGNDNAVDALLKQYQLWIVDEDGNNVSIKLGSDNRGVGNDGNLYGIINRYTMAKLGGYEGDDGRPVLGEYDIHLCKFVD